MAGTKRKRNLTALRPVSFPAIEPSKSTSFNCYLRKEPVNDEEAGQEFVAQSTFVAGEAEAIEFFSSDESQRASAGSRRVSKVYLIPRNLLTLDNTQISSGCA